MDLSIIVPTYNEAENIRELLERIEGALMDLKFEVIFVDDGSPDGTADLAETFGNLYGNVKVLRRPCKMGLASAVLDGVKLAKAEVIAVMDGDLQHPPELLPKMYEKINEGYCLVVASRYVAGGETEDWSTLRKIVSLGVTGLARFILPKARGVKDPLSGYFMLKKGIIKSTQLNSRGYKILLEVLVKGEVDEVAEVPYIFRPRKRGKSKLSLKEIIHYLLPLLRLKLKL